MGSAQELRATATFMRDRAADERRRGDDAQAQVYDGCADLGEQWAREKEN